VASPVSREHLVRSCPQWQLRLYCGAVGLSLSPRGGRAAAPIVLYDALSGLRRAGGTALPGLRPGPLCIAPWGLGISPKLSAPIHKYGDVFF
jgi:hypothetical protein